MWSREEEPAWLREQALQVSCKPTSVALTLTFLKTPLEADTWCWARELEQECYQTSQPNEIQLPICFVRLARQADVASAGYGTCRSLISDKVLALLYPFGDFMDKNPLENCQLGVFSWLVF
jgi:hypothetical protein